MESSFHHIVFANVRNTVAHFLPFIFSITLNIISVFLPRFGKKLICNFTFTGGTLNELVPRKVHTLKVRADLCINDKIIIKLAVYMENLFLAFVELESAIVLRKSIGFELVNEI